MGIVTGLRQKGSVSVGAATARDLVAVTARRPGSVLVRPIFRLLRLAEVEHIEEIADRRPVDRYVRVVAMGDRVRKIVAAAVGERPPRSCSSLSTVRPKVRSSRAPGRRGMPTRAETLCGGRPDPWGAAWTWFASGRGIRFLANYPGATIVGGFGVNQGSGNGGLIASTDALEISHGDVCATCVNHPELWASATKDRETDTGTCAFCDERNVVQGFGVGGIVLDEGL